jgi:hypothetical protein
VASKKRGGGKWIQAADREMERKGTKGAFGKATSKKIARGIKRGGLAKKRAVFAKNMKRIAARRKRRG